MIKRFGQLTRWQQSVCILLIVFAGCGLGLGAVRLSHRTPSVPTFELKRAEFLDSLQFRGEVKAMRSVTISAPADAGDLQITKLSPEGTAVKPGDVVVQFDSTKTEQDLAQYRSTLKSADAEIGQAKAQARLADEEDKTAVIKAGYEVESAKLEASKQEIVSKIEGEEARLKLADAEQKLREAEAKQKSDAMLNGATIQSKEEASKKAKFDVDRAERALGKMVLKAPSAGTVTLLEHWGGSGMVAYRAGDRAWPGASIAELPDADSLRMSARVDETERGRLAPNQLVTVQLNAIPDRQFTGRIEQIGAIASVDFAGGWPLTRNFTLEIILDQFDPRFKPGLSGEITVIVDRVADALTIPAQAVFQRSGENVAYVWQGTQFAERPIEIARRSGDKIMIAKGLRAGDQIALKDPTTKE
jgi:HlyD family secretion protein